MKIIESQKKFLEIMKKKRVFVQKQLKQLPQGRIKVYRQTVHGKEYPYYRLIKADGKRISITKDHEMVRQYALKLYYEIALVLIEENIRNANQLVTEFHDISYENILNQMPADLKPFLSVNNIARLRLPADPIQAAQLIRWSEADYERNRLHPEYLTHRTTSGSYVRSKSEAVIFEKLKMAGLAFRYEELYVINGIDFHPDFKILRTDMTFWYWEHCGMMNDEKYIRDLKWRLSYYEKEGITIWKNLILTFDDLDGNLDVGIIDSEIRNKLLLG